MAYSWLQQRAKTEADAPNGHSCLFFLAGQSAIDFTGMHSKIQSGKTKLEKLVVYVPNCLILIQLKVGKSAHLKKSTDGSQRKYELLPEEHKSLANEHKLLDKEHKLLGKEHKALGKEHKSLSKKHKLLPKEHKLFCKEHKVHSEEHKSLSKEYKLL